MIKIELPKRVAILGATGDVGSALSRKLSAAGSKLVLLAKGDDRLSQLGAELHQETIAVDALEPQSIDDGVRHAHELLGGLDGVTNCIGSVLLKPAHLTSFEEWSNCIALNLTSCFAILKSVGAVSKEPLSIVLVSSAAASIGLANHEAIAAAKAGVEGLVLSASATYASKGIRVNAVAPGLVETKLTEKITSRESSRNFSLGMHPVGRLGTVYDAASAISWLLSPEQSWITGQTLGVDGGLSSLKVK